MTIEMWGTYRVTIYKKHHKLKTRFRWKTRANTRVVVHHTAGSTAHGAISTLNNRGLGYHYLIKKNGKILELAPPDLMVYHARGENADSIGVSLVGQLHRHAMTKKQENSLIWLLRKLDLPVWGHGELMATICPGFDMDALRTEVYKEASVEKIQFFEDVPSWGQPAVQWAMEFGILKGVSANNLGITHGDIRTLVWLYRATRRQVNG